MGTAQSGEREAKRTRSKENERGDESGYEMVEERRGEEKVTHKQKHRKADFSFFKCVAVEPNLF